MKHLSMSARFGVIAALILLPAGCDPGDDDDSSADDDDDDVASAISSVEVDVSEVIGTVVAVSWETVDPTTGHVEFGLDDGYGRQVVAQSEAATTHEVTLLGLKADTEYAFRVVAEQDTESIGNWTGTFTTGPLPDVLAGDLIDGHAHDPEKNAGGFFVVPLFSEVSIPTILDSDGDPVWWHVDEVPHETITTVHLTRDRTAVIYNAFFINDEGAEHPDDERIIRVSLDGRTVDRIEAAGHTHNFVELEDGTLAYIAEDHIEVDEEAVRGNRIMELHPDGTLEQVWSVWDHFEYDAELVLPTGTGYTHANALDYDEGENAYYLSLRSQDCVLKVDRASAQVEWVLGGPYTTFEIVGTEPHSDQHQFQIIGDQVLIFDNGDVSRYASRVVEYSLDHDAGSASLTWDHYNQPPLYIISGGDVTRFPSGNTLVTWSSAGLLDEVDENSELVWRLFTRLGYGFGFTQWVEDIDARPAPAGR